MVDTSCAWDDITRLNLVVHLWLQVGGGWKRHGEAEEEQQTVREGKRHSRERGILLCLQSPAEGKGRVRVRVDDCLHREEGEKWTYWGLVYPATVYPPSSFKGCTR